MSPLLVVRCHSPEGVRLTAVTSVCSWISAPRAACALAQRHGEVRRRDVAVVGVIQRADDLRRLGAVAELDQRPQIAHFLGSDDLEGHADGIRGAAVLLVFVHALAAGREAQIAGDVEAHVLAGFGRQPLVQIHRVLVQLADRVAHVEQRQQARRMPGGPGGQFGALEQHHVGPAFEGQMIERADADHAAANDDDAGMSFQVRSPNANARGSVTSGPPNKRPIATIPDGNAPAAHKSAAAWRPERLRMAYLKNDRDMSETDKRRRQWHNARVGSCRFFPSEAPWNRPPCCASASTRF